VRSLYLAFYSVCLPLALAAAPALAGGFAHSANFLVFVPAEANTAFAQEVLDVAEQFRAEIANDWLGEELPPSVGRAVINIAFSEKAESAFTWAKDHPDRKFHNVYITASRHHDFAGVLHHEIAHVVLATRFAHPHRLPAWAEEWIASQYDDAERMAIRRNILSWYARTGTFPRLGQVVEGERIAAEDQQGYAVAASLTDLLLARADRQTLLAFARDTQTGGWDRALKTHYGIDNLDQLQQLWEADIRRPTEPMAVSTGPQSVLR